MEQKFIQFLLALNKINQKLKSFSDELDELNRNLIDEDFDKLFFAVNLESIKSEDFD